MHFYQQSSQELDPDEPLGICTTTFTNPPTQEQHFSTKKAPPGATVGSDKGSRHNAQYSKALPNFNNIFLLFY